MDRAPVGGCVNDSEFVFMIKGLRFIRTQLRGGFNLPIVVSFAGSNGTVVMKRKCELICI